MWPVINSSALIGGKFIPKKPSSALLSECCNFNQWEGCITGHEMFNGACNEIFQPKTCKKSMLKNSLEKLVGKNWSKNLLGNTRRKYLSEKNSLEKHVGNNLLEITRQKQRKTRRKKLIRKQLWGKYSSENTHQKILIKNTCPKILFRNWKLHKWFCHNEQHETCITEWK